LVRELKVCCAAKASLAQFFNVCFKKVPDVQNIFFQRATRKDAGRSVNMGVLRLDVNFFEIVPFPVGLCDQIIAETQQCARNSPL
jgi:hypothetical protein